MKLFMLKGLILASIMFICVLFGMQIANDGIVRMKGFEDPQFKGAFTVSEKQEEVQVSLLGNDIDSHDLEKKKEQIEEMKAYNMFSDLGKTLASTVSSLIQYGMEFIYRLVE